MPKSVPIRVQVGTFELNLKTAELRNGESLTRLPEQLFRLLLLLVDHPAELVSREDIRRKLWPNNTIVEFDQSIQTAISKLRRALGDSADSPKYVETVGRRGYRLIASVQNLESSSGDEIAGGSNGAAVRALFEVRDLIGKQVSHYRVLEVIGGGGMGMVYKAEDLKLGRRVALKFLPEELATNPVALQRFEREARTASSLNHPNICTIYEVEEHDEQPFIVMELLEGETLRDRLAALADQGRTMPWEELIGIATQIANGLEAAHEQTIIHRDIKPANVFLTRKGTAKILDFGLAKLTVDTPGILPTEHVGKNGNGLPPSPRAHQTDDSLDPNLTRTGLAMGTAGYMSPEQVRGENLDARTDLFSFGLVLYEMATGQRAFTGETAALLKDAILHRTPLKVRELNGAIPRWLEKIVGKAIEKDREKRYQSAGEIRTALEQAADSPRLRWQLLTAVAVLVAAVALGFLYWRRSHREPPALSADDTIVLGSFSNTTGDPIFDSTLRQGLDLNLQQSPRLRILSERKISEALTSISHKSAEVLTPSLARQVCTSTHSRAVLSGSIANQGNSYLIGLQAADCQSGRTLAIVSSQAENRDRVLHALGEAGTRLRISLGDPTASQAEFNQPLDSAATASLDALQEYGRGLDATASGDLASHLKRAAELDPKFALAHQQLGRHYMATWQSDLASQSFAQAYALRDRLSLRHKLPIEASYYLGASGDLENAVRSFSELLRTFPESGARNQLCFALRRLGRLEQAVAVCREAIRFNRNEAFPIANAIYIYVFLDRLLDAQAILDEARAESPKREILTDAAYMLAFARKDDSAMQRYFHAMTAEPGVDAGTFYYFQAYTETYYGHLDEARRLWPQAVAAVNAVNLSETVAGWRAREALLEAELGNALRARQLAAEAMALNSGRDVSAMVALTLARAGDTAGAEKLADQLNRRYPQDTLIQFYELPVILASIELQKNNSPKAIEILAKAAPYEQAITALFPNFYPPYVRGQAYLQAGEWRQAAVEFQKVLEHPGLVGNYVTFPLAYLQLARAQARIGDETAARKSYQNFFNLWKDADPEIPIYRQSKAEYVKLQ